MSKSQDHAAVIALEALYPYLSGHVFARVEGSRSGACIFCGAFREQHPEHRQGSPEPISAPAARLLLAELDRKARGGLA